MALSNQQKKVIDLLNAGRRLRIVRSPLDGQPVYAEFDPSDMALPEEKIPWWRIERLVRLGFLLPEPRCWQAASQLVLRSLVAKP